MELQPGGQSRWPRRGSLGHGPGRASPASTLRGPAPRDRRQGPRETAGLVVAHRAVEDGGVADVDPDTAERGAALGDVAGPDGRLLPRRARHQEIEPRHLRRLGALGGEPQEPLVDEEIRVLLRLPLGGRRAGEEVAQRHAVLDDRVGGAREVVDVAVPARRRHPQPDPLVDEAAVHRVVEAQDALLAHDVRDHLLHDAHDLVASGLRVEPVKSVGQRLRPAERKHLVGRRVEPELRDALQLVRRRRRVQPDALPQLQQGFDGALAGFLPGLRELRVVHARRRRHLEVGVEAHLWDPHLAADLPVEVRDVRPAAGYPRTLQALAQCEELKLADAPGLGISVLAPQCPQEGPRRDVGSFE
mmetsp:Transcript_35952/g.101226  ORF Transcript_35952/g.101226 Transcript_35952/m.101226 type:complete len:359 (+) Transcript_35952:44-1120(+)